MVQGRRGALHHHSGEDDTGHNPVAGVFASLEAHSSAIVGAAGRGCAVGQSTINDEVACAVDLGNCDKRLVECCIASVAHDGVQVAAVVILIATTRAVFLAQASDGKCFVGTVGVLLGGVRPVLESVLNMVNYGSIPT
jgi:hypothetical protein